MLALSCAFAAPAHAHRHGPADPSRASALSLSLPVAVVLAAPVAVVSAGASLTVVSVQASARGSVWVLERASDGMQASIEFAGDVSQGIGTVIAVSAIGSGMVLSAAGDAIAFVPNEIGRALLHDERLTGRP